MGKFTANITVRTAALLAVMLVAAGCSGASASPSSTPPPSTRSQPFSIPAPYSTTPSPPTTSAASIAPPTTTTTTTTSVDPTTTKTSASATTSTAETSAWKAPDYGTAQPAVDAYLTLFAANRQGLRSPSNPPSEVIKKHAAGQGYDVMMGSITDELSHGWAWRGTAAEPRLVVVANKVAGTPPEVVLSDCPLPSASWEEYDVKTGEVVPQPKQSPPPPYEITIQMFELNGTWVMTSFKLDASKTCTR